MAATAAEIKSLRDRTGAGMLDCKKALAESNDDMEKAIDWLRAKGMAKAASKAGRIATEGVVSSYIHGGGKIGVLVEINCETDFAARSDDFRALVHDIAMHIAAASPRFVRREDVPEKVLADEKEIARAQAAKSGKPPQVAEKIVEGRIEKFYAEACLLEQAFVKDPDKPIRQLVAETVSRIGENVQVRRFARFVLGEAI